MQSSRVRANITLVRIGTEVLRRRQTLDHSQAALAAKAGVHANVVGRIERGTYNPTIVTLEAIAAALDTSLVDLLRRALK
jgi:XRE family transcriptional regulator, regulator of sulfur utilization